MRRCPRPERSARDGARGYVLLSALWLLLLAGLVTAVMLAATRKQAEAARETADMVQLRHVLASAIATAAADRLFTGPTSQWWKLPATGEVMMGQDKVTISISNEAERIDLNRASREAMIAALGGPAPDQSAPIERETAEALVLAIERRRAEAGAFYSARDVDRLSASARPVADRFTVASGAVAPRPPRATDTATAAEPADAIRITACGTMGRMRGCQTQIGRVALQPQLSWQIVDGWSEGPFVGQP